MYRWLSAKEHVLARPDTYVGAVAPADIATHVFETAADGGVRPRTVTVHASPALLKLFDEVVQNACDNAQRDSTQRLIHARAAEDGTFSVHNDGRGIPIRLWATPEGESSAHYLPEVLFGELLSGENFDDTAARTAGGRNGIGVKAVN